MRNQGQLLIHCHITMYVYIYICIYIILRETCIKHMDGKKKNIDLLGIHHAFFAANTFVNVVNSIGPWRCLSLCRMSGVNRYKHVVSRNMALWNQVLPQNVWLTLQPPCFEAPGDALHVLACFSHLQSRYVKLQVLHKNGNQIRGEPLSLPSPG